MTLRLDLQILNKCSFDIITLTVEFSQKECEKTNKLIHNIEWDLCTMFFEQLKEKVIARKG